MLVDIRNSLGVEIVDIYPYADNEKDAAFQKRVTVYGDKIVYGTDEYTLESYHALKDDLDRLKSALDLAASVIVSEVVGRCPSSATPRGFETCAKYTK